jgi:hypothetical protein
VDVGLTEPSTPRPVALATASITGLFRRVCAKKALERATVRALESSATAEIHKGWNIHQMEHVSPGNCALNQDPAPPAHLLPELRPELLVS